jgi:pimeloyl-ACP methyl ester carboxylesterase
VAAIKYRTADVEGCKVFYRESGSSGTPKLLLLHGFPSASHMFRDLIPLLADRFHLVAPDLPGFGNSAVSGGGHTFDRIAESIVWQYTHGVPDPTAVSPDGYSLDKFYLAWQYKGVRTLCCNGS